MKALDIIYCILILIMVVVSCEKSFVSIKSTIEFDRNLFKVMFESDRNGN